MPKIACPYCYHRFRPADARYQCTGRLPSRGDRCTSEVDPDRQRLTGYTSPAPPTFAPPRGKLRRAPRKNVPCDRCGSPTGIRACPVCRTPLPSAHGDGRSPLIGVIGGKNSGKTVYTTVLVHELRHRTRRRFDADAILVGEQAALSEKWLQQYERALFDDSSLFESTPSAAAGIRVPLLLQWRRRRRALHGPERFDTTLLSFYDTAGEDLTAQEVVNGQSYLGAANGLIVLLDPFQLPGTADRIDVPGTGRDTEPPLHVLTRITEMLRGTTGAGGRRRVDVPLAVVFSKIDAFYRMLGEDHPLLREPEIGAHYAESTGQDTDEHLRALLAELGADEIDAHLRAHYRKFRYFAVSALGAEPDYARRRVDPGGVRPFRVDEPLLWLLAHFGVIGRSRR